MKSFHLGQIASTSRAFTESDVAAYRSLSGDHGLAFGPGQQSGVPGPLLSGMFSCLLGTKLPGRGTNWLKQSLSFPARASPNERITASVEIVRMRSEKGLVNLRTVCTGDGGRVVCEGEALVLIADVAPRRLAAGDETVPDNAPRAALETDLASGL
ncbi:MAG: hypothetical protein WD314_11105, partial [Trueperaceae bacterium]